MEYVCFIDLETGGLDSHKNPVLQIGCVIADDQFNSVDEWSTYVKPYPGLIIEDEAIRINGITPDKYEIAPTEAEALNQLNILLFKYDFPIFYGFNIAFDLSFLGSMEFRNKTYVSGDGQFVDVKRMVRFVTGSYKYSLKSQCAEFGVINEKAHDGLGDCHATLKLAKAVLIEGKQKVSI